jgi:hypothetical protein
MRIGSGNGRVADALAEADDALPALSTATTR